MRKPLKDFLNTVTQQCIQRLVPPDTFVEVLKDFPGEKATSAVVEVAEKGNGNWDEYRDFLELVAENKEAIFGTTKESELAALVEKVRKKLPLKVQKPSFPAEMILRGE